MPGSYYRTPLVIDHIIARQHAGKTTPGNLALACLHCNSHKGPNVAGVDPQTGRLTRLYHPRRHRWSYHFRWNGPWLVGRTAIGRTTIEVLARISHQNKEPACFRSVK
ncbi:MAG: HNH endonuclease [Planctomycetia bacterium]|nr:HNH endonuclease [Planctomycetia bacterium]